MSPNGVTRPQRVNIVAADGMVTLTARELIHDKDAVLAV